jgi:hypothetical protein
MWPDAIKEIIRDQPIAGWAVLTRSQRRFSGSAVLAPASCLAWPCRLTAALQLTESFAERRSMSVSAENGLCAS